jgi:ferritin-like metal-binding protein YciE
MTKENPKAKAIKPKKSDNKKSDNTQQHAAIETMQDAFIHELSDMRNGELQLTKALPRMAKAATDPQLANAFETHLEETMHQIELIDQAVKISKIKLKRKKCDAMEGLIAEGQEIIKSVKAGPVRDAMLIAAGQKVEHYEIASYGSMVAAARRLGMVQAAELLDEILDQEKQTDRKLNQLAEQGINQDASMQDTTRQEAGGGARYDRQYSDDRLGRMSERYADQGRFMSDNDRNDRDRYYSDDRSSRYDQDNYESQRFARSGYYDDYDRGRGQGQGGRFGGSEGNFQAAHQGGQGYRSSSTYDRDDNNSRYSGRGQDNYYRSNARSR